MDVFCGSGPSSFLRVGRGCRGPAAQWPGTCRATLPAALLACPPPVTCDLDTYQAYQNYGIPSTVFQWETAVTDFARHVTRDLPLSLPSRLGRKIELVLSCSRLASRLPVFVCISTPLQPPTASHSPTNHRHHRGHTRNSARADVPMPLPNFLHYNREPGCWAVLADRKFYFLDDLIIKRTLRRAEWSEFGEGYIIKPAPPSPSASASTSPSSATSANTPTSPCPSSSAPTRTTVPCT